MISRLLVWLFGDLVKDEITGMISPSKTWGNAANCTATTLVIRAGWNTAPSEGLVYLLAAYLALVGGSQIGNRILNWKMGGQQPPANGATVTAPVVAPKTNRRVRDAR